MSLSSSLNVAVSGLDISSRRAEVVAQNVANADRAGYARRSLNFSGSSVGAPGSSLTISRDFDHRIVQIRREAQSRLAGDEVQSSFLTRLDAAIGDPDQSGSLQDRLARLDAAFVTSASDPQSASGLQEVVQAAQDLAAMINRLDDTVTDGRQRADADIGRSVEQVNSDLANVSRLNADIRRLGLGRQSTANLMDQRSVLIDRISQQIPVREMPREGGGIALVSTGGILLLDGKPAELGFATRAPLTPEMSFPVQLSGLTVNGRPVSTSSGNSAIPGGALASLFELRDVTAPEATARLDGLAAELIDRFEDPAVDTTRASGTAGLFTESAGALSSTPLPGLAGRLGVNALVDPDQGGNAWHLREGIGAIAPSTSSDASLLLRYGSAMADRHLPVFAGLPDIPADMAGHASALKSLVSADRLNAEDRFAFSSTEASGLVDQRDGGAVNIDAEMRRLIEIEQAYAANVRIVQAVSDMMNRLTEI